jgi:alkanesulfonate monooxygenase SsuD/methylene tetrahydromethanopterin reductase-like flavin-dependent oxidoreductase (luciferase family)
MKVGIFQYLSTAYAIDPAVLAKRAEELGFDSLWLPEHPIMPATTVSPFPLGGPIPAFYAEFIDPFIGLARASAVTQTIKLGTGICLVPERNPLLLAKEIATLDHLSGGQFIFGIGAGWVKEETEIMGGRLRAPLDADPGCHHGDEGPLDHG